RQCLSATVGECLLSLAWALGGTTKDFFSRGAPVPGPPLRSGAAALLRHADPSRAQARLLLCPAPPASRRLGPAAARPAHRRVGRADDDGTLRHAHRDVSTNSFGLRTTRLPSHNG